MKIEHTLLRPGPCPICDKEIIEKKNVGGKTSYRHNKFYTEIWVLFNDGTHANFAICKDCRASITPEQKEKLIADQIFTWGQEVVKQMLWFVNTACHLKAIKWGHTKSAL